MMDITSIINLISTAVTAILVPLIGVFQFREARARKAAAEARKLEVDNISSYAAEWKELYEKKESRVNVLDEKIDSLYAEIAAHRKAESELREELQQAHLKIQALEFMKCEVRGCDKRKPPSGY